MSLKAIFIKLMVICYCVFAQADVIASQSPDSATPSSAQTNVQVVDAGLQLPGVERPRKLRIYLPPNYHQHSGRYPVLYMHDAQNLFDRATAYAGEWQVDETLNQLYQQHGLALIVVGIDNGADKRLTELSAWDHQKYGKAEGTEYLAFITDVVKPYIDQHYRSLPSKTDTAIMGSSMGGLMSHYAVFTRPDVFGKAGIYSPSYWYAPEVFAFSQSKALPPEVKLDFVVGSEEGEQMAQDMLKMVKLIKHQHADDKVRVNLVSGGQHNEGFWSRQFAESVLWLFTDS